MSQFRACLAPSQLRGSPRPDVLKIKRQELHIGDARLAALILGVQFHHLFKVDGLLFFQGILRFSLLLLLHCLFGLLFFLYFSSRLG